MKGTHFPINIRRELLILYTAGPANIAHRCPIYVIEPCQIDLNTWQHRGFPIMYKLVVIVIII